MLARLGLTKLKEKKEYLSRDEYIIKQALGTTMEFTDDRITVDHPYVAQSLLDKLHAIDSRLQLRWELQHYFEHRWHITYEDETMLGPISTSITILQYPRAVQIHQQADFVPFDDTALDEVRRLMHQIRNGTQAAIVAGVADAHQIKQETEIADREDMAGELDKEQRRLQERILGKRNISDPGWERGIGIAEDGTPFIDGPGAHTSKHTVAI